MLCYQSWHEMNQDLTPVMLPILTWEKTWVESSIKKKSGDCHLNSLLENCLKTQLVGFRRADVLGKVFDPFILITTCTRWIS